MTFISPLKKLRTLLQLGFFHKNDRHRIFIRFPQISLQTFKKILRMGQEDHISHAVFSYFFMIKSINQVSKLIFLISDAKAPQKMSKKS